MMNTAQRPATTSVKQTTIDTLLNHLAHYDTEVVTLASVLFDDPAGKGFQEITAEMRTALGHLDAIIAAYQNNDGLGPMLLSIREAKEWRGVRG